MSSWLVFDLLPLSFVVVFAQLTWLVISYSIFFCYRLTTQLFATNWNCQLTYSVDLHFFSSSVCSQLEPVFFINGADNNLLHWTERTLEAFDIILQKEKKGPNTKYSIYYIFKNKVLDNFSILLFILYSIYLLLRKILIYH